MNYISYKWESIDKKYKYTILGSLLFGVFAHGMGLFNKYSMNDDLNYFFNYDYPLEYGRWMEYYLIKVEKLIFGTGSFSLPIINGSVCLLFIGITLCLLVNLLEIKSIVSCILLSGFFVSVPSIVHLFGDMYLSHFYSIALFLSVLGPYFILKYNKWYSIAVGIILMILSTAIYQGFIPVMLSTFLFTTIKMITGIKENRERIELYRKICIMIFSCLMFISLYFVITFTYNDFYGVKLINYKGVDQMGKTPLSVYLSRVYVAYKDFFFPSKNVNFSILPGNTYYLYYVCLFLFAFFYGKLLYSRRKVAADFVMLMCSMLLIPLSVNFLLVMVDQSFFYMLMLYSKVMFFVILVWIIEYNLNDNILRIARMEQIFCFAALSLFLFMYCRFDNICYVRIELLQSEATRYFSTLITRMQSMEGYDSYKYVSYIGEPRIYRNDNSIEPIYEFDDILFYPYNELKNALNGPWRVYLKFWCGYSAHEIDQSYFKDLPEVQEMSHYPADGSIKIINDTLVVKF